jgi:hypothetical protein
MLTRTLNVVCRPAILPPSRYLRFFWSSLVPVQSAPKWLQAGYGYPGFIPELAAFSELPETQTIRLYPGDQYYGDKFMAEDHAMALPDTVDDFLNKVFSLNTEDSKRFAIASAWFSQVPTLWRESNSAAFVAVVSALEALLDKTSEVCRECKQSKHRVTKKFKTFIEENVPNVKSRFPEELKQIYKVRSDLAHGAKLLLADLEYWNFFVAWREQQEHSVQASTHDIVGAALRNWVLKH